MSWGIVKLSNNGFLHVDEALFLSPSQHLLKPIMPDQKNNDNLYKEGALVVAKMYPEVRLRIVRYYQRIYYCSVVGDETRKHLVYFERELVPTGE